jgi:hypothetical protein
VLSAIDDVIEFGERNYHGSLMYPILLNINAPQNVYSYCVECLENIDYLVEARLNYNNEGGGANRVLCKRSLKCYYASILRLQLKLSSVMSNL